MIENKLSAYQCHKKSVEENVSDVQFRQLLIDNGIIQKVRRVYIAGKIGSLDRNIVDAKEEYTMGEKYGAYTTITELRRAYFDMIIEHYRVLKRGGWFVMKCQNFIHGKKSYFIRNEIHEFAKTIGFKPIDEFILLSKNRFTGKVHKQRHARKFHCYFLVFQK